MTLTRDELATLPSASPATLQALAQRLGVDAIAELDRRELRFAILAKHCELGGEVAVAGAVDVLPDGTAFLRSPTNGYWAAADDVFVGQNQVRHLGLRQGHWVAGPARAPGTGERFFALMRVATVDGDPVERLPSRLSFAARSPVLPTRRLRLASASASPLVRAIDRLAPWGMGQRALVVVPPAVDRTALLGLLATAARGGQPDLRVLVGMCDARPEDLAALDRDLTCRDIEVAGTAFDAPAGRHVALAAMLLSRAQRLVEAGRDVIVLFDSLSALVRASNLDAPPTGRQLSPGLDAGALQLGKRLFAAARACEEGGTLTVVATALAGGTRFDDAVLGELRGRGNSEVVLGSDGWLDIAASATRHEDLLLSPPEGKALAQLRTDLRNRDAVAQRLHFANGDAQRDDR